MRSKDKRHSYPFLARKKDANFLLKEVDMELNPISTEQRPPEVQLLLRDALHSSWGEERRKAIERLAELEATAALLTIAQRSKWTDERKLARESFIGLTGKTERR